MIKWSFSGLKDFTTCPRQYNEVKIHKRFTKKVTEQMNYGTVVHKALEDYVRDGIPLAKNYERYRAMVDPLLEIEGTRHPELKMALRENKTPCDFDAEDYWVRGIVDFLVIDGDTAYIVDYKTGSARYPDLKQLKLMALMTFAHHNSVRKIKAGLLFVAHNMFIDENYSREQIDYLWEFFTPSLTRLRIAMDTDTWTANPSPLCGWCPVTTCQYNKG
jgi:hypothetical protein